MVWGVAVVGFIDLVAKRVQNQARFQIDANKLGIEQLPAWLLDYTRKIVPLHLPAHALDVFDPAVVRTLACAYEQNPWVERVVAITKKYPNHIQVTLALRRPLAWIDCQNSLALCDVHATRLPGEKAAADESELPVIYGTEGEMPQAGKRWRDNNLAAALQVVSLLSSSNTLALFPQASLHLEKTAMAGKQIVLVGQDPAVRIVWGEALASEFPQVSSAKRVAALRHVHQIVQQLDASEFKKIAQFDIRFGYVIVHAKEKTWKTPNNSKKI